MLSRFYNSLPMDFSPWSWIGTRFNHFIQAAKKRMALTLQKRLIQKPNGIVIIHLMSRYRIVNISPDQMSSDKAIGLLNAVMYSGKNARRGYDYLPFFTGLPAFLSTEDMSMRRKHIVPYLHSLRSRVDYFVEMNKLLVQLRENNQSKTPLLVQDLISNHLLSLFTRSLLGTDFPEQLKTMMKEIEQSPYLLIFALLPSWAIKLLPLLPPIRRLRRNYHNAIKNFLVAQIESLKNGTERKMQGEKNWLANMLLQKVGDTRLISEKEIDALANDPEIRMPIALMLGTSNLTRIVQTLLTTLFSSPQKQATISRLILELSSIKLSSQDLLNKEKMPFLHAIYLEALRKGTVDLIIPRVIQHGITIDDVEIPPHSFVAFNLDAMSKIGNIHHPAGTFAPERFINEHDQLKDDIRLHEGWFTPFGIGKNMCPAYSTSELIIKHYLVAFTSSIQCLHINKVEFYEENSHPVLHLKTAIKHSFFKPKESKEEKIYDSMEIDKVVKKISGIVAGYCL